MVVLAALVLEHGAEHEPVVHAEVELAAGAHQGVGARAGEEGRDALDDLGGERVERRAVRVGGAHRGEGHAMLWVKVRGTTRLSEGEERSGGRDLVTSSMKERRGRDGRVVIDKESDKDELSLRDRPGRLK